MFYVFLKVCRAHMGPAWALEEPEKIRKNYLSFYVTKFSQKNIVFNLHRILFNSFNVFFRFLAEIRFRAIIKLPQKANSRTKTCSFSTSCTLP